MTCRSGDQRPSARGPLGSTPPPLLAVAPGEPHDVRELGSDQRLGSSRAALIDQHDVPRLVDPGEDRRRCGPRLGRCPAGAAGEEEHGVGLAPRPCCRDHHDTEADLPAGRHRPVLRHAETPAERPRPLHGARVHPFSAEKGRPHRGDGWFRGLLRSGTRTRDERRREEGRQDAADPRAVDVRGSHLSLLTRRRSLA